MKQSNQLCHELAQKTKELEHILPASYHFHKLAVVGSGGFGAVFDSGYHTPEGRRIVRKIDRISSTPIPNSDDFKLFKSVYYELRHGKKGAEYHLFCQDYNGHNKDIIITNECDAVRLQKGVIQYEALRQLKGERNFQQIVNNPDTNMERQFFSLDNYFYVEFSAEYLPGETLRSKMPLDRENSHMVALTGRINPYNFIKVVYDLSKAQKILRDKKIIHGDIKPENVLLSDNNSKLIDFGSAEFYRSVVNSLSMPHDTKQLLSRNIGDQITGTLGMFAPELLNEMLLTHRSDAYSAGAMYVQCLTGKLPYLDYSRLKLDYFSVMDVTSKDFEKLYQQVLSNTDYNKEILRPLVSLCHPEPKKREVGELMEVTQQALEGKIPLLRELKIYIPDNSINYDSTGLETEIEGFESNDHTQTNSSSLISTSTINMDDILNHNPQTEVDIGYQDTLQERLKSTMIFGQKQKNKHLINTT